MRLDEDERRRRFAAKYGCHLPSNLIAGLTDTVAPVIAALAADFDGQLPQVSASGQTTSDPASSNILLSASFASTYLTNFSLLFRTGPTKIFDCS